jgi:hypothetical protein
MPQEAAITITVSFLAVALPFLMVDRGRLADNGNTLIDRIVRKGLPSY